MVKKQLRNLFLIAGVAVALLITLQPKSTSPELGDPGLIKTTQSVKRVESQYVPQDFITVPVRMIIRTLGLN
ncbi:MAG: hypothetical protein AAFX87_07555 [Bacteroidota bacterium]